MATIEDMVEVVNNVSPCRFSCVVTGLLYQALRDAERRGRRHRGGYGAHDEPCTYWLVGDYIVTYYTDDLNFSAEMLFDDMMYDLIIEGV
jgi:hypothetical protein